MLSLPGVTHVIVLEGINDIGNARQNPTPTAEDLIAGHKQLIEQAHARGIKIYGATLTPFWGAAYYTDVGEAKRQAVNEWIRTEQGLRWLRRLVVRPRSGPRSEVGRTRPGQRTVDQGRTKDGPRDEGPEDD